MNTSEAAERPPVTPATVPHDSTRARAIAHAQRAASLLSTDTPRPAFVLLAIAHALVSIAHSELEPPRRHLAPRPSVRSVELAPPPSHSVHAVWDWRSNDA